MKRITKRNLEELTANCIDEKDRRIIGAYYYMVRYRDEVSRLRFYKELRAGFRGMPGIFYINTIEMSSDLSPNASIQEIKNKLANALCDSYVKVNLEIPNTKKAT